MFVESATLSEEEEGFGKRKLEEKDKEATEARSGNDREKEPDRERV